MDANKIFVWAGKQTFNSNPNNLFRLQRICQFIIVASAGFCIVMVALCIICSPPKSKRHRDSGSRLRVSRPVGRQRRQATGNLRNKREDMNSSSFVKLDHDSDTGGKVKNSF
ncbi:MAG: hypothetical protein MHMPM18_004843 [Marteilia pararefringens]